MSIPSRPRVPFRPHPVRAADIATYLNSSGCPPDGGRAGRAGGGGSSIPAGEYSENLPGSLFPPESSTRRTAGSLSNYTKKEKKDEKGAGA